MTRKILLAASLAVLQFAAASAASAQSLDQFTYTEGGETFSWVEAASPVVTQYDSDLFAVAGVPGDPSAGAGLFFYDTNYEGGFSTTYLGGSGIDLWAAQVFSGTAAAPTFVAGTYTGIDHGDDSGATGTLTIASITAVPEPTNLALLLAGVGLVGMMGRRRRG
jgi:hypothetical protein